MTNSRCASINIATLAISIKVSQTNNLNVCVCDRSVKTMTSMVKDVEARNLTSSSRCRSVIATEGDAAGVKGVKVE